MFPGTFHGEVRNSRADGSCKTEHPESSVSKGDTQQDSSPLSRKSALAGEGWSGEEGLGTGTKPCSCEVVLQSLQLGR